jgi:hypothetical protein
MTQSKSDRYGRIAKKAAIICACCLIFFFVSLLSDQAFSVDQAPRWLGIILGTAALGSLVTGTTCIAAVIWGHFKTGNSIDDRQATCPTCGAMDDFSFTVEPRGSFSLLAFLGGGLPAVIFRNMGRGRRVRCNKCEARFYVRSPFSKVARVCFWLLVAPTIFLLIAFLIRMVFITVSQ